MTDLGLDSYKPEADEAHNVHDAHVAHDAHNLVFVGSGASASFTVLELLEQLGRLGARPASPTGTVRSAIGPSLKSASQQPIANGPPAHVLISWRAAPNGTTRRFNAV